MNNAQARMLLAAYRPGGEDANDPVFREAMRQSELDPLLTLWFAEERKLDEAAQRKLAAVEVPPTLLPELLAIPLAAGSAGFWRRTRSAWAAAAGVALLVGGLWAARATTHPRLALSAFPHVAAALLNRPFQLEHTSLPLESAERWAGVALRKALTQPLLQAAERGIGCRTFRWRGRDIRLFCFSLPDGEVVHFFVMDAQAFPDAPPSPNPQFAQHRRWSTATWSDEAQAYVLASSGAIEHLKTLL